MRLNQKVGVMEFLGEPDESAFRNASESAGKWFHAIDRIYTRFPDRPNGDVTEVCELLENLRREVVTHGPVIRRHKLAILDAASVKGTPAFQFGLNMGTVWTSAHFASLEETESFLRDIYYLLQPFAEDRSEVDLYRDVAPGQLKPLHHEILSTLSEWVSWHDPLSNSKLLEDWIRIETLAVLPSSERAIGSKIHVNDLMMAHINKMTATGKTNELLAMGIKEWRELLAPKRDGKPPSVSTIHDTAAWKSLKIMRGSEQAGQAQQQKFRGRTGDRPSLLSDDDED